MYSHFTNKQTTTKSHHSSKTPPTFLLTFAVSGFEVTDRASPLRRDTAVRKLTAATVGLPPQTAAHHSNQSV